MEFGRLHLR